MYAYIQFDRWSEKQTNMARGTIMMGIKDKIHVMGGGTEYIYVWNNINWQIFKSGLDRETTNQESQYKSRALRNSKKLFSHHTGQINPGRKSNRQKSTECAIFCIGNYIALQLCSIIIILYLSRGLMTCNCIPISATTVHVLYFILANAMCLCSEMKLPIADEIMDTLEQKVRTELAIGSTIALSSCSYSTEEIYM